MSCLKFFIVSIDFFYNRKIVSLKRILTLKIILFHKTVFFFFLQVTLPSFVTILFSFKDSLYSFWLLWYLLFQVKFSEKFDAILLMKLDILDLILLQHSQFEIICWICNGSQSRTTFLCTFFFFSSPLMAPVSIFHIFK